jgi:hypothetical protein
MIKNGHLPVASQPKRLEFTRKHRLAISLILLAFLGSVSGNSQITNPAATPEANLFTVFGRRSGGGCSPAAQSSLLIFTRRTVGCLRWR